MSIESISGSEGVAEEPILDLSEMDKDVIEVDFNIYSKARPKICTAYEEINRFENSRITILLSDGSQWNIEGNDVDKIFNIIQREWKIGDDIRIKKFDLDNNEISETQYGFYCKAKSSGEVFVIKNVRNENAFLVQLSSKCEDVAKAVFIKCIDPSGYSIITNDGRIWVAGYFGSSDIENWQKGDRIIINKGDHADEDSWFIKQVEGDYYMINPRDQKMIWMTQIFENKTLVELD